MAAAHLRIGDLRVLQDRPGEAIPSYEAALMFNPLLLEAHWRLGRVHAELGRPIEAARHYRAELILRPQTSLLEEAGTPGESERQEAALYCDLGNVCAAAGDVPQAMQCYQRAVEISPALLPRMPSVDRDSTEGRRLVLIPRRPSLLPSADEPAALTVLFDRRDGRTRNGGAPGGAGHEAPEVGNPIGALGMRRPIERRHARVARVDWASLVLDDPRDGR
jgi:tetratricopeptide (TPR) repeat protein